MNFLPVEIEEAKALFSIAQSTVNVITRLYHQFNQPDDDEGDEYEDRKDCIKEAISILTQETQAKKSPHLKKFVENTLLDPEHELEPSTIFSFLKDIDQMTWRQICLIEVFRRVEDDVIEIDDIEDSEDINTYSRVIDLERLTRFGYLYTEKKDLFDYDPLEVDEIEISGTGTQIAELMDLESISIEEITRAYGHGIWERHDNRN